MRTVLIYAVIGLLICAATLSMRWITHRRDALGRARPFPAISTGLCLIIAAICAVPTIRHAQLEHRLTTAAEQIGHMTLQIHCQTAGEAAVDAGPELGFVKFGADGRPEHRAVLKWQPCRDLSAWLGSHAPDWVHLDAAQDRKQLIAVHVLTHETMHITGITDEAVTECRAMQRDAAMAQALGATQAYGRALAQWYWTQIYPQMPDAYRTNQCAPGGSLDEHRPDPPWVV